MYHLRLWSFFLKTADIKILLKESKLDCFEQTIRKAKVMQISLFLKKNISLVILSWFVPFLLILLISSHYQTVISVTGRKL